MDKIVSERQKCPFEGIDDLVRRVPELPKKELVTLGEIGALNALGREMDRRRALWQVARVGRRASGEVGCYTTFSIEENTDGNPGGPKSTPSAKVMSEDDRRPCDVLARHNLGSKEKVVYSGRKRRMKVRSISWISVKRRFLQRRSKGDSHHHHQA